MKKVMDLVQVATKDLPSVASTSVGSYAQASTMFLSIIRENNDYKREIARIERDMQLLLKEAELKSNTMNAAVASIFHERKMVIGKIFDAIDHGIKTDNMDLISACIRDVCSFVQGSPFKDLKELGDILNGGRTIEL